MKDNLNLKPNLKSDQVNIKDLDTKLKDIVFLLFEEKLSKVLIRSQYDFFLNLEKKCKIIFESKFDNVSFEKTPVLSCYRELEKELIENFKKINKLVTTSLNKYQKEIDSSKYYLLDFQKHCKMTDDCALHNCNGKMYMIYEKGLIKYIVCEGCKMLFYPAAILLFCQFCSYEYSSYLNNSNVTFNNLIPATLEDFHCKTLSHDIMRCIKCKEVFYLNIKENNLYCKACKFSIKATGIIWQCLVCKADYKSAAKPYNHIEMKIYKKLISHTLNLKQKAKPVEVPCCKLRVYDFTFFHKKTCNGELFQMEHERQEIIVCSKCKTISYFESFIWTCPKCYKRFRKSIRKKPTIVLQMPNSNRQSPSKVKINESELKNNRIPSSFDYGSVNIEGVYNSTEINLPTSGIINSKLEKLSNDLNKKLDLKAIPKPNIKPTKEIIHEQLEKKAEVEDEKNNFNIKINKEEKKDEHRASLKLPIEKLRENEMMLKKLQNFKIEDLKILQTIGEGANGVIYIVQNVKREKFAMKKIIVNSDFELQMYTNEYELIHKLNHPNIVKIIGISYKILDDTTNVLYILMELAKSDWHKEINLRAKNNYPFTEEEITSIIKEIIDSLHYLQVNNIAHRDIKPHNILLYDNNLYKLADFGEAKVVKMISKKELGTVRGTELYMAPVLFNSLDQEEIVEHNPYKSDVFSLGYCILLAATLSFNILYELRKLTNKKEIFEVITKHLSNKFSQKFIQLVCRMVEFNEKFRMDFIQLKDFFNKNLLSG